MNTEFMITTALGNLIALLICIIGMVIFFKFILPYLDKSKQKKKVRKQRVIKNPYKYFRLNEPMLIKPGQRCTLDIDLTNGEGDEFKDGPVFFHGFVVDVPHLDKFTWKDSDGKELDINIGGQTTTDRNSREKEGVL